MRAVQWLYWNSGTWSSSDIIVMLKLHYHIMSHLSVFRNFLVNLGAFFNHTNAVFNGEQEKESTIRVRVV